eukprot:TRINITY_DN5477_c7_g1_i1.p1 TRINITY_DN5477_c7_g1~~TRINITY_DN5477_c7_g1_i1.p1  ORF type:complete len:340 (+),score=39.47 TRINITY_DN5477_c7_g1_i1:73-1020(+)
MAHHHHHHEQPHSYHEHKGAPLLSTNQLKMVVNPQEHFVAHRKGLSLNPESLQSPPGYTNIVRKTLSCRDAGILPATYHPVRVLSTDEQPKFPLQTTTKEARALESYVKAHNLPDTHQMYSYGKRDIQWSRTVPVGQPNTGVVVIKEFWGTPHILGEEIVTNDDAIQNQDWRRIGAMNPRAKRHDFGPKDPEADGEVDTGGPTEDAQEWRRRGADWSEAVDYKGLHYRTQKKIAAAKGPSQAASASGYPATRYPDFQQLQAVRDKAPQTLWHTASNATAEIKTEIMNEMGVQDFYSNPQAVSYAPTTRMQNGYGV